MCNLINASVAFTAAILASGTASAQDPVVVEPEVETWIMKQPSNTTNKKSTTGTTDAGAFPGSTLPDTVDAMKVPKYEKYNYAVVNNKRVLIDSKSKRIIKVY